MDVLRSIRKGSAVVFTSCWLATIATAVTGATVANSGQLGRVLVAEIFFAAVAATATLVYVVATLTTHIDDTQWSVGYADRIIRQTCTESSAKTDASTTKI